MPTIHCSDHGHEMVSWFGGLGRDQRGDGGDGFSCNQGVALRERRSKTGADPPKKRTLAPVLLRAGVKRRF
jgi:hypothetical protein